MSLKLMGRMRLLSVHLARFCTAVVMICHDMISFLVVLSIFLVGMGQAIWFVLAPNPEDNELDDELDAFSDLTRLTVNIFVMLFGYAVGCGMARAHVRVGGGGGDVRTTQTT